MTDHPLYTNRLIHQKSPYLLQHAHNPVDWYSWGEEAFQAAETEDKPIFLSIGYATCHWCHVMEKESFENVEIAEMMNDLFINIKIDREELPDVDSLYMEFAQTIMAGAVGWPLNVILTPKLHPFFATTYLPPQSRHGLIGLKDLILRIQEVWESEEREQILMQAEKILEAFSEHIHVKGDELPEKEVCDNAIEYLFKISDSVHGGIRGAPKFPIGYQYNFMLHYSWKTKDGRALFLVEKTLDMMHRGGIYDHLGGGFSRYSVDEQWIIPHFEKMLYDNAILVFSYLESWLITKKPFYQEVCEEIIEYILREMRDPEGGFYSAQDADSEGEEGRFYTWTPEEVCAVLGNEKGILFCEFYGVREPGNFHGRSILHMERSLEDFALMISQDPKELAATFKEQRKLLWKARERREHPFKDDKVLSSWNGLMIASLVAAGTVFKNQAAIDAAVKAAYFVRNNLWKDQHLLRRWREGDASYSAGLDEYAFMIRALLSLFMADCGVHWLEWAIEMTDLLEREFKAPEGAFYQTNREDPYIILRRCQFSDGAEPSGNGVHCENLLKLYQLTLENRYLTQAEDIFRAAKRFYDLETPGYSYHMMNLYRYYDRQAVSFVIALNDNREGEEIIKELLYSAFIPHSVIIWKKKGDKRLIEFIPFVEQQNPIGNETTLYICREGSCEKPLIGLQEIRNGLSAI